MRALITGATGFIGRRLVDRLDSPVVLSRDPDAARRQLGDVDAHGWQPRSGTRQELPAGIETLFHLAGEPVAAGRWTAARKERIRRSRVEGTQSLVAAIEALSERPHVLVCASAVGYYGDRGDEVLDESAAPGDDFLANVCRDWEAAAQAATAFGVRVVNVRIGIVLGRDGGALERMLPLFRLGLGGRLGHGRQWMPWVHVDDVVELMLFAAENEAVSGPVNAVAPAAVTNRDFTATLGRVLHRPAILPAPAFALRLALGEMAGLLLASQRVVPATAQQQGYAFRFAELEAALAACV